MRIAVVGGGLAGLSAALELVDASHDVTVYEARPTLGGAVQTLPRREGDPEPPPDNGQHIALGCFTEYLRFLDRIGQSASVRRAPLSLPVIDERGRAAVIEPSALALLRYRHVSVADRVRILWALARWSTSRGEMFGDELRARGQSEQAIDRFWDVFIRPALNLRAEEASAAAGNFTVATALLGDKGASDLVLPTRPLGAMHGEAAGRALEAAGATVHTSARVDGLDDLDADAVVVAVPARESSRLLGEPEPPLEDSPIVSVHLLFDRPLLRRPLAALLGSPAHWVFNRGLLTSHQPEADGRYLTVVSSGAPELEALRGRELVELIADAVTARLGAAELLWSRVSREPNATIAVRPGSEAHRPGPETSRPNVVRAGAWTGTGWPATMEGAVRSGRAAVRALAVTRQEVPA
ncbi:MAG TPA: hydroxysqualene dehydroxylase HpnE [Gaiellaceae bacterium]|nr:hydroxysqualene dehydroxylase HpnE [Gaiellaceae bacterium]